MGAKPKRKARQKPVGGRPKSPPDRQAAYAAALTRWFREAGYHVGLDVDRFSGAEAVETFGKLADKFMEHVPDALRPVGMHFMITPGADSEALFEALEPFMGQADIVASRLGGGIQTGLVVAPLVLFADSLTPEEIRRRFDTFLVLGEALDQFAPRLNFQDMGQCRLYPLLLYFDSARYRADVEALLADGWQLRAWKHVALQATFADFTGDSVERAEMTGLAHFGAALGSLFGVDSDLFHFGRSDLAAIRKLAEEELQGGG